MGDGILQSPNFWTWVVNSLFTMVTSGNISDHLFYNIFFRSVSISAPAFIS